MSLSWTLPWLLPFPGLRLKRSPKSWELSHRALHLCRALVLHQALAGALVGMSVAISPDCKAVPLSSNSFHKCKTHLIFIRLTEVC